VREPVGGIDDDRPSAGFRPRQRVPSDALR
jgi:hypothetical protein